MDQFITRIRTNLNGVLEMTQLFDGLMMTGDNLANRVIVELNRDGVPLSIDSDYQIIGYVIRNDGYTLDIPGAIIEEGGIGHAYIDIPDVAYYVSGPLSIAIRMIKGNLKVVIATATCYVNMTSTTAIIDTAHRIPDVEELLAHLEEVDQRLADINAEDVVWQEHEATRVENENTRITSENARITSENSRAVSETNRRTAENARAAAEAARVLAEENRVAAENVRVTAENARETAEGVRESQEATRQSQQAARNYAIDEMSISAETLPYDQQATATITDVTTAEGTHKHITLGLVTGHPFAIKRTFASIAEMEAYSGTDLKLYDFVCIESNVEDPDNAKLFMKVTDGWFFITDLSGSQGIQGPQGIQGYSITGVQLNADYTLTVFLSDGTSSTVGPIRGAQGEQGVSISNIVSNQDYTLTIVLSDGREMTTTSMRGAQGRGIVGCAQNPDYTLTILFTDGDPYITPEPLRGATGAPGPQGERGYGVTGIAVNADYTLTITFGDGQTYTTPFSMRGPKGEKGDPGEGSAQFYYDDLSQALTVVFG